MRNTKAAAVALVLGLAVSACGGVTLSSSSATSSVRRGATATSSTTAGGTSGVTTGPLRAALHGANHRPKVNTPWAYSVTVTDAMGRPLWGTVDIEFAFGGQVVGHDSPPTRPVRNGRWHDMLTFPAASIGQPLTFRAVVHTSAASVTLDWPIVVQR